MSGIFDRYVNQLLLEATDLPHIFQPNNYSCGPTCIKMVADYLQNDKATSISKLCKDCGTDTIVGTPPEKMKNGLDNLNLQYKQHINESDPYTSLQSILKLNHIAIVRTITQDAPHWIVIYKFNGSQYYVNDPWLGKITYTQTELDAIWKPRDYFYFEIIASSVSTQNNAIIRIMTEKDYSIIYNRLADVYSKTGLPNKVIAGLLQGYSHERTLVATVNNQVTGFYFIGDNQISLPEDKRQQRIYNTLKKLKGIEGIGLGVFPEFKGKGIGRKLIEASQKDSHADYIWGMQYKSLENIKDWLKRRKIYADKRDDSGGEFYITYQVLKPGIKW